MFFNKLRILQLSNTLRYKPFFFFFYFYLCIILINLYGINIKILSSFDLISNIKPPKLYKTHLQ